MQQSYWAAFFFAAPDLSILDPIFAAGKGFHKLPRLTNPLTESPESKNT